MKKIIIYLVLVIIVVAAGFFIWSTREGENAWVCQDGQWVKVGNPEGPQPTGSCGQEENSQEEMVVVDQPQADETVSSPLLVKGKAPGYWYFEGDFPILLLDADGEEIATAIASTQQDWMTEDLVPFEAELEFEATTEEGTLVLKKDNPSGLPQNEEKIEIPIKFEIPKMTVEIFFGNSDLNPEGDCDEVFSVNREIEKTQAIALATLRELFKGPSQKEQQEGYLTGLNEGVKIQDLVIEDGVAKVDFNQQLQQGIGGSCMVEGIKAQIKETLKQFNTVDEVTISIDGQTEGILQP